ncbi:MAG: hypothetical protein RIE73_34880 [Coleofasciculus sp. C1-SOL-03]
MAIYSGFAQSQREFLWLAEKGFLIRHNRCRVLGTGESAMSDKDQILEIFFKEYDKLKSEQAQRIGFRDNLLYVTLGVFGGVVSFAVSNPSNYYALLVIPWVCLILGWTYVVNDEKISAIGRYIRYKLVNKVKEHTGYGDLETLFGWEIAHRSDKHRKRRKIQQLIVDEITFVFSGIIALSAFWFLVAKPPLGVTILSWVELLLLILLGVEMFIYADLAEGR